MKLAAAEQQLEEGRGALRLNPSHLVDLKNTVEGYERGLEFLQKEFAILFPSEKA